MDEPSRPRLYRVRLETGRVLGPIDRERIRLLVEKGHVTGREAARLHGESADAWQPIASFEELRAFFGGEEGAEPLASAAPAVFPGEKPAEEPESEKTLLASLPPQDATQVGGVEPVRESVNDASAAPIEVAAVAHSQVVEVETPPNRYSREATVVIQRPGKRAGARINRLPAPVKGLVVLATVALLASEILLDGGGTKKEIQGPFRPTLPELPAGAKLNPEAGAKLYQTGMGAYVADTAKGYREAAASLRKAAALDPGNAKAFAMLASCYLNLLDSSAKDETTFSVIWKLLEMTRAKAVDLPETVIADVEFYLAANKAEAAQARIVDYTKTRPGFDVVLFVYLAQVHLARGDPRTAATYAGRFPENRVYSARIPHLRGAIAEALGDGEAAIREYEKALAINPSHAKSRLRLAEIQLRAGKPKDAEKHAKFLVGKPELMSPRDLARAHYLRGKTHEAFQRFEPALDQMEAAASLDRGNHDYLYSVYDLRAKLGQSVKKYQKEARMYFFLGEGERAQREGKTQEAIENFLMARQANPESAAPLARVGDLQWRQGDVAGARESFRKATEIAKADPGIWSKYLASLIQSYEWEEATRAMDRFRSLPVNQSVVDKAAADLYARQGKHVEAQAFYKKAMAKGAPDADTYVAFGKSLMATQNHRDAPFFLAMGLLIDPLNVDAVVLSARSVAAVDGIDRGISFLRDELQKGPRATAELLAAVADFQTQKGDWDIAEGTVRQAIEADPRAAAPWKVLAAIEMNRESADKKALDRALDAYQSYSERNPSDPSGYLERYRVFLRKQEFEKANEELLKIYASYPKYPNFHFYKGALYAVQGNQKLAIDEYRKELANNPGSTSALIALGKALVEAGDPAQALGFLAQAMKGAPGSSEAKHWAGYANFLVKNYEGAIALYRSALQMDQANPLLHKRLGLAIRAAGDPAGAAREFRRYLEMEPDAADKAEIQRYL